VADHSHLQPVRAYKQQNTKQSTYGVPLVHDQEETAEETAVSCSPLDAAGLTLADGGMEEIGSKVAVDKYRGVEGSQNGEMGQENKKKTSTSPKANKNRGAPHCMATDLR
jgi:hypothetical protein